MIQRPQYYTSKALNDWKMGLAALRKKPQWTPEEEEKARFLTLITEKGTKFLLPEGGFYFDDLDPESYTGAFHLPFKQTVLECGLAPIHGPGETITKMIVCASEVNLDQHQVSVTMKTGGGQPESTETCEGFKAASVFVWVFSTTVNEWQPLPLMGVLPYGDLGALTKKHKFEPRYSWWSNCLTLYKFDRERDPKEFDRLTTNALTIAMLVLLQTVAVLNCSNVRHEEIKEPKFINMKRMRAGQPKLDAYRILTVDDSEKVRYEGERSEPGWTGTHRRQHVRRGHIRRYQTGRTIWINQMIVGKAHHGVLEKDYKLRKTS